MHIYTKTDLAYYLAEYIAEERARKRPVDVTAIENALESFEGGAYNNEGAACEIIFKPQQSN